MNKTEIRKWLTNNGFFGITLNIYKTKDRLTLAQFFSDGLQMQKVIRDPSKPSFYCEYKKLTPTILRDKLKESL